jgi:CDP-2,3-bis-(O-geranylgeranyl)-sn-glycerol synthase
MNWLQIFWFFLPAGLSNTSPPIIAKIPGLRHWNTPIDFGKSWRGVRIFGDHKTWRGLVMGSFVAGLFGLAQYYFLAETTYSLLYFVAGTTFMGFGALAGDAVESFFKRRRNIGSGKSWFPLDQIDYIIGGLAFSYPFFRPTLIDMMQVAVLYFVLHLLVGWLSYKAKIKDTPI